MIFKLIFSVIVTIILMLIVIIIFFVPGTSILFHDIPEKLSDEEINEQIFNDAIIFYEPFIANQRGNTYFKYNDIKFFNYTRQEISFVINKKINTSDFYFDYIHEKATLAGWELVYRTNLIRKYCDFETKSYNKTILEYNLDNRMVSIKLRKESCDF